MKKYIVGIIIGLLISTTIVTAANYLYKADEVSYTPKDNKWNVNNVEGAINDLYDKADNSGAIYLGEYSSNTTIDVSSLNATNVEQFIASCDTNSSTSGGWIATSGISYTVGVTGYYEKPILTLNNNNLEIKPGYMTASSPFTPSGKTAYGVGSVNLPTKVYYVGNIRTIN